MGCSRVLAGRWRPLRPRPVDRTISPSGVRRAHVGPSPTGRVVVVGYRCRAERTRWRFDRSRVAGDATACRDRSADTSGRGPDVGSALGMRSEPAIVVWATEADRDRWLALFRVER
jgi:hypothetical protein